MKILKVTVIEFYEIGTVMEGNSWSAEDVVADWFGDGRIRQSHVSRTASLISNARVFVDSEVVTAAEMDRYFPPLIRR